MGGTTGRCGIATIPAHKHESKGVPPGTATMEGNLAVAFSSSLTVSGNLSRIPLTVVPGA